MSEKTKKMENHPIRTMILTMIGYGILYVIAVNVVGIFAKNVAILGNKNVISSVVSIIFSLLVLEIYWLRNKKKLPGFFSIEGTGRGVLMGWSLLVLAIATILLNIMTGQTFGNPMIALIMGIAPGISEEILFRIIPLSCVKKMSIQDKNHALFIAYLITGIAFGLVHGLNILVGADPVNTALQVLYAIGIGLLFAGIYLRTGNMWISMILHSLLDVASLLLESMQQSGGVLEESTNWQSMLLTLVYTVVIYINAIMVIRAWRKNR